MENKTKQKAISMTIIIKEAFVVVPYYAAEKQAPSPPCFISSVTEGRGRLHVCVKESAIEPILQAPFWI